MAKLLLTGFEPFGEFPVNPTMKIVADLDGRTTNGYDIVGKVLPVDFIEAERRIAGLIGSERPDVVLSLGLFCGRDRITPERVAINCRDGGRDNSGRTPQDECIEADGPAAIFSTLPIREMVERIMAGGLPSRISNTAETYVCNNVMYKALWHIQTHGLRTRSGLIHIPASHEAALSYASMPSWSDEDLLRGVSAAIQCL